MWTMAVTQTMARVIIGPETQQTYMLNLMIGKGMYIVIKMLTCLFIFYTKICIVWILVNFFFFIFFIQFQDT